MKDREFIENIRQEIRENGFMSGVQVASLIARRGVEFGIEFIHVDNIIEAIPCDDIKIVEYATWLTKDYRAKDLYYFSPQDNNNASAQAI